MELELKNLKGQVVGEVGVSETLFGTPFNPSLVHQAMVMYQLNRRQGTHKVKGRSEVSGGGAKPWRQKHTGRARAGSNRSPIWRHGGVTFGPRPRSYRRDMPKKMRHLALRCVLSEKLKAAKIVLIEGFDGMDGRTKEMTQVLKALEVTGSILIVTRDPERAVIRSAHNIPRVWTLPVNLLNAEDLLKRSNLVLTLDALRKAEDMWGSGADTIKVATVAKRASVEAEPEEAIAAVEEEPEQAISVAKEPEEGTVAVEETAEAVTAVEGLEASNVPADELVETAADNVEIEGAITAVEVDDKAEEAAADADAVAVKEEVVAPAEEKPKRTRRVARKPVAKKPRTTTARPRQRKPKGEA